MFEKEDSAKKFNVNTIQVQFLKATVSGPAKALNTGFKHVILCLDAVSYHSVNLKKHSIK